MANIVELREMDNEKLEEALENAREEMFNLRFQRATGRLENYSRLTHVRREMAQIVTVLNGREKAVSYALENAEIARALAGKSWAAKARFNYETSTYVVEFTDAEGAELANAQVNINTKRRGAREARRQKPVPQRIVRYEVG